MPNPPKKPTILSNHAEPTVGYTLDLTADDTDQKFKAWRDHKNRINVYWYLPHLAPGQKRGLLKKGYEKTNIWGNIQIGGNKFISEHSVENSRQAYFFYLEKKENKEREECDEITNELIEARAQQRSRFETSSHGVKRHRLQVNEVTDDMLNPPNESLGVAYVPANAQHFVFPAPQMSTLLDAPLASPDPVPVPPTLVAVHAPALPAYLIVPAPDHAHPSLIHSFAPTFVPAPQMSTLLLDDDTPLASPVPATVVGGMSPLLEEEDDDPPASKRRRVDENDGAAEVTLTIPNVPRSRMSQLTSLLHSFLVGSQSSS